MLLGDTFIGLECWSMIINIKYSFFFMLTWISTFIVGMYFRQSFGHEVLFFLLFTVVCCCRKLPECTTYTLIQHILLIAASSVLLFYDVLFLRQLYACFWSNNFCNGKLLNLNCFDIILGTSKDINWI